MTKQLRCVALVAVAALSINPRATMAQQWRCYPFLRGETAAAAATRIGGKQPFRILDPSTSTFVSKSRHSQIRRGWLACTWDTRGSATLNPRSGQESGELDPLWLLMVALFTAPFATVEAKRRWKRRRVAKAAMMQFGRSFIGEFERPLRQSRDPAPGLRARLRLKPGRYRMEVLLAPLPGHSYPNLSDHRNNVEYDRARVYAALGDTRFVSDSVQQQGDWVVLGFRARGHGQKAGAL